MSKCLVLPNTVHFNRWDTDCRVERQVIKRLLEHGLVIIARRIHLLLSELVILWAKAIKDNLSSCGIVGVVEVVDRSFVRCRLSLSDF